jgi:SsrA-binding protein|tara:strand:- start:152 stop:583 length:432 start_codon:yes stop_codon:yes gene_type:complete
MKVIIRNKKASYEYKFIETFTAGIMLQGSEVKSLRAGKASIAEAYCYFVEHELFIKGMSISVHKESSYNNHDPYRDRKLLLTKKELKTLKEESKIKGLTVLATKIILTDKGLVKLEIALGKGKKLHDKRNAIKERDISRDMDQ